MGATMKRTLLALAAAAGLCAGLAGPAQAADLTVRLTTPSGAVHSVLTWDDSTDTLCLTLRSGSASASADADMRLGSTSYAALGVRPGKTRDCTGNLSIPEDRWAQMRLYGGTDRFHDTTGWRGFHT